MSSQIYSEDGRKLFCAGCQKWLAVRSLTKRNGRGYCDACVRKSSSRRRDLPMPGYIGERGVTESQSTICKARRAAKRYAAGAIPAFAKE